MARTAATCCSRDGNEAHLPVARLAALNEVQPLLVNATLQ